MKTLNFIRDLLITIFLISIFLHRYINATENQTAVNAINPQNESNVDDGDVIEEDECSNYGPITQIVAYLGNHLSTIINNKNNLFFSPFSISVSLAMVYLGARGETAKDMEIGLGYNKLNLSNPAEDIHNMFYEALESLDSAAEAYHLEVANGIFVQDDLEISPNYIEDLNNLYNSKILSADFKNHGNNAVTKINNWVSNYTSNKIMDLLKDPLDPATVFLLVNAIYFRGIWKYQFSPTLTVNRNFYVGNITKRIPFMEHKNKFLVFQDDINHYSFIELDYSGEAVSMIFAVPYRRRAFPSLEITTSLMCRIRKNFRPTYMHLMIPKFNLSYEKELSSELFHLGLGDLFSEQRANLTGIRPENDLFVSAMIHKANIELNEEGSVASAATAVSFTARSGRLYQQFKVNHPFLFCIVDKRTGVILFLGRVVDL